MDGTKVPALDAHFELEAQYEKKVLWYIRQVMSV